MPAENERDREATASEASQATPERKLWVPPRLDRAVGIDDVHQTKLGVPESGGQSPATTS